MMTLRVKKGVDQGKSFGLAKEIMVLGRDSSADVNVRDDAASRKHAEVFNIGEMYFVKDLGSRNGTIVNDELIEEELLRVGDRIRIGATTLVFEDEDAKPEQKVMFSDDNPMRTPGKVDLKKLGMEARGPAIAFEALSDIAKAISSERQIEPLLKRVAKEVHGAITPDETYVFVEQDGSLKPMAVVKARSGEAVSTSIISSVMETKKSVLTMDAAADSRFRASDSIVMKGIHSVVCAPLVSMGEVTGVIYSARTSMTEKFSDDDLELVTAVAMMTGVALEGIAVRERQRKMLMETLSTLVAATELRDASERGHSERVSAICGAVAVEMKFSVEMNERIQLAGLLHDIGKVAISETGLHSVGQIKEGKGGKDAHHVLLGEKILENMPDLSDVREAVKTHHEAWDGSGFPQGLSRENIPIAGRIVAVANAFDHFVTHGGGHGDSMSVREALMKVGKMSGKKYDPETIRALLVAHRNGLLFSPKRKISDIT